MARLDMKPSFAICAYAAQTPDGMGCFEAHRYDEPFVMLAKGRSPAVGMPERQQAFPRFAAAARVDHLFTETDHMSTRKSRIITYSLIFAALGLSAAASLQATLVIRFVAEPTAIATIDWLAATEELDEWKAIRDSLDKQKQALQEEANRRKTEQEGLLEQLELLGEGNAAYEKAVEEYRFKVFQNQGWVEFKQEELQRKELQAQIGLYNKISEAVAAVATRDGWDIVIWDDSESKRPDLENLQRSLEQVSRRIVLYTDRASADITKDVVQFMNNNFRSGGG